MSIPVSTGTVRKPNLDVEDGIEYPSSDGKPMGETGTHARVAMMSIFGALYLYFLRDPRVAVHADMFIYYAQGDPRRNVCPDVFVARDVDNDHDRRSYKVWKEGKAPDVVFEVTSKKTRKPDLTTKFDLYRDVLKVREYYLFDPFEEYLNPSLQGYRLVRGAYEPIPIIKGGMPSEVLGLELQRRGVDLCFYNPETSRLLPGVLEIDREVEIRELALREARVAIREEKAARREEEAARREADAARLVAEAEVERLRREIESLRVRPPEEQE
jgi:Uma2 family endonuclease